MNSKFNAFWNEHGSDLQAAGTNKFSAYFIWKSALEASETIREGDSRRSSTK